MHAKEGGFKLVKKKNGCVSKTAMWKIRGQGIHREGEKRCSVTIVGITEIRVKMVSGLEIWSSGRGGGGGGDEVFQRRGYSLWDRDSHTGLGSRRMGMHV